MKKIIFFLALSYVLSLLATSFLVHIPFLRIFPNVLILFALFIAIGEDPNSRAGLFAALGAGFFLDIFSQGMIGVWAAILFICAFFIKTFKRIYVRVPLN